MGDPLSPEKLLEILRSVVLEAPSASSSSSGPASSGEGPASSSTDTSSSSNTSTSIILKNSTSLIALLIHSIHTSLGFRQTRPAPPIIDSDGNTSQDSLQRNKLNKQWFDNSSNEESFAFEYRHDQSSLVFQVRIGRLGGRTVINAVAVEDDKTATLDIVTNDYTSTSNFPKGLAGNDSISSLSEVFNSQTRLNDFIKAYKVQIIQKLLPGLVKPGYNNDSGNTSRDEGGNPGGRAPPPSVGSSQPRPDTEIDTGGRIGAPPNFPRPNFGQNPLEIGRSDLDPLGGTVGRLPGAGGDGMYVGPNHPLFGREQGQENPLGGVGPQRGPWGGDGFLPPLGAPPGARFDPISPFGIGGNVPNQQPRRNWGDEFPPPGFDNELDGNPQRGFNPLNPGGGGFGGGNFGPGRGGFGGMGGGGNMFM